MFGSRLSPNSLIFSDDILVDIQLVTFLFLSHISELRIGAKTKKFWQPLSPVKHILSNKNSYPFSDICEILFVRTISFVLFEVTFLFEVF